MQRIATDFCGKDPEFVSKLACYARNEFYMRSVSHVLTAMHCAPAAMDGSFRVSLSRETTKEDLDKLTEIIRRDILPRVR